MRIPRLSLALLFVLGTRAVAEESAPPFIVRDTRAAAIALETAAGDLLGNEPRRGLAGIQHVLDDVREDLVVESSDARQTRWIPAPEAARRLLLRAPSAVRADYDVVSGPTARALLDRAVAARDEAAMSDVVARFLPAAPAIDAARLLAELWFERGRAFDAAAMIRRALRYVPEDLALWRRLIDALEAAGAAPELEALTIPAEVTARDTGAEASTLAARLRGARARTASLSPARRAATAAAARDDVSPVDPKVHPLNLQWSAGSPPPLRAADDGPGFTAFEDEGGVNQRFLDRRRRLAPFFPAPSGRNVIVSDGFSVSAYDALSGTTIWSFERPLPGLPLAPRGLAWTRGRTHLDLTHRPYVADGVAYAVLETVAPYVPRDIQSIPITTYRPRRMLIALDAATGEPRWHMGESSPDARALEGLSVVSDPVVSDGVAAVVLATWEKRWRVFLAGFDAAGGTLLWKREVVGGQQELNLFGEVIRELCAGTPAIEGGVLYATTGLGVFVAADLRTGELRWMSTYPTTELARVQVWFTTPMRLPCWGPSAVVVHGDAVLAAPAEGPFLLCFERADGRLRWRERAEATKDSRNVDQFLGVVNDGKRDLAVVTHRVVKALLLSTGETLWHEALPASSPSGDAWARGRGAISKTTVYVPTARGLSRWSLAAEGLFQGEDPWPAGTRPGNVCLFPDSVIVAAGRYDEGDDAEESARPIQAFYDLREIEARLAARRAAGPNDPVVLLDEADLWRVMRQEARSEPLYEAGRRLAQAAGLATLVERGRRGLYLLRRARGDDLATQRKVTDARAAFSSALQSAASVAERVEIRIRLDRLFASASLDGARVRNLESLVEEAADARDVLDPEEGDVPVRAAARFKLAEIHRAAGRAADAVDALQSVLEEDGEAVFTGESARARATREIAAILKDSGPEPYARHEREARKRLDAALLGTDLAPFERLLAAYPNASIVPGALLGQADRLAASGASADAAASYRRFLASYPDRPEGPSVFARLARALAAAKSLTPARATLRTLERRYPDATFTIDGAPTTGAQFAARERERLGPAPVRPPERAISPPVTEILHEAIETERGGARVVPMSRASDEGDLAPVCLDVGNELIAVDAEAGRIAWRKPWDRIGPSTVLVGDVLVVARPDGLVGLEPRTGQEQWKRAVGGQPVALDGGLGQVLVLVKRPGERARAALTALDPITADVLWTRELVGDLVDGLVAGEDGFVVVRRRAVTTPTGATRGLTVLSIHALISGESIREVPLPADAGVDALWRLIDPRTLVTTLRDAKGVRVEAIDVGSGTTRWSRLIEDSPRVRHLLPCANGVTVIGIDGRLRVLAIATGEITVDTAITGGVETLFQAEPIVDGGRLYAILRTGAGPSTVLAAFDLASGRAVWTLPTKAVVSTGWLRKSGDWLVAIQAQRRGRDFTSPHLITLVDAKTGTATHRIDGEGLSGWQPSAAVVAGALVVVGEHAFAVYR